MVKRVPGLWPLAEKVFVCFAENLEAFKPQREEGFVQPKASETNTCLCAFPPPLLNEFPCCQKCWNWELFKIQSKSKKLYISKVFS